MMYFVIPKVEQMSTNIVLVLAYIGITLIGFVSVYFLGERFGLVLGIVGVLSYYASNIKG